MIHPVHTPNETILKPSPCRYPPLSTPPQSFPTNSKKEKVNSFSPIEEVPCLFCQPISFEEKRYHLQLCIDHDDPYVKKQYGPYMYYFKPPLFKKKKTLIQRNCFPEPPIFRTGSFFLPGFANLTIEEEEEEENEHGREHQRTTNDCFEDENKENMI